MANLDQSNNETQRGNTYRQFLTSALEFGGQLYHLVTVPLQIPNDILVPSSTDENSPSTPIFPGSYLVERCDSVESTVVGRLISEEVNASDSQAREESGQHDTITADTMTLSATSHDSFQSQRVEEPVVLPSAVNVSEQVITSQPQVREELGKDDAFGDRSERPIPPTTPHNLAHNKQAYTPVASESTTTQFQGAHNFSISGSPNFTNIRNINNYGGFHGLEHMEKFVSFNAFHNSAVQDPDRKCHPGTRVVVLNPECAFWLHGPAGAGKSAIAQTIARSCREQLVATFFFYKSDASRNDGNRLFTTIAWQLAFLVPGIKDHIIRALERRPDLPRMDVETQFEDFIVRPFQALKDVSSHLRSLVVIIDGVDECIDEKLQRRFLKVIGNAIKDDHFPLRFFICSRPEPHIQETIDRFPKPSLQMDLASLDDANHDIEKYLKDEFARVASEQGLDSIGWPGDAKIQQVLYKSSGQFVYASTVIRYISDEYNSAVTQLDIVLGLKPPSSESPFAELDALFMEILERQPDRPFLMTFLALLAARLSITPDDNQLQRRFPPRRCNAHECFRI